MKILMKVWSPEDVEFALVTIGARQATKLLEKIGHARALNEQYDNLHSLVFFDRSPVLFSGVVPVDLEYLALEEAILVDDRFSIPEEKQINLRRAMLNASCDGVYWTGYVGNSNVQWETSLITSDTLKDALA